MKKRMCLIVMFAMVLPVTGVAGAESKPMIRDIEVGYLLNCNFRANRPYMWRKKVLLTGWETDDRGGIWESNPTGLFGNNQFGFHVEWFRLHDTSAEHAVTIKHQIARQDSGTITLEYRFGLLPKAMDGISWQLRDMNRPAVTVVTKGRNLCYQADDGSLKTLQPYKKDVTYGVRIVADIDRKQADIFVDGQLRASDVPFLNSVKTIDYVLIKTGDKATGDLYLNPVNIYKGYNLCETFVSASAGSLPSDWKAEKRGKATVEVLKSAAAPDVFSLKLDGGSASRQFDPIGKKTVFEFCFMTPVRTDTVVELCRNSAPVLSLGTHNNDLCIVDKKNNFVPLVKNYVPNLWYAVKVIVEASQGKAEVYVNGKLVTGNAPCRMRSPSINSVHLAVKDRGKLMWADDIKVYPWRDYPADYVPEPRPVNKKDNYLIGVQSCSLWKEGNSYAGWDYVYPYADKRKPYLGWYDEGSPEVADWEIKWQVEHGIDFEQYCWYRPNDAVNHPIKNGVLEHGIRQGLFNARYSHHKKFTIMYTNEGAGKTNADDWSRHIIPYWIEYFFKDPRYLKVNGKPLLAIYDPNLMLKDFGGVEGRAQAIAVLRKACRKAGFPGIIVLMEDRSAKKSKLQQMKSMGIDYCYSYTWSTCNTERQKKMMTRQRQVGAALGLGVIPSFSVGWRTTPWGGGGDGMASTKDYKALAKWTRETYMPLMPENSLGCRMALLPNWNEYGEGHFLIPTNHVGFGYLDALREVFTGAGPHKHKDDTPTKDQKKRFTVFYPKD